MQHLMNLLEQNNNFKQLTVQMILFNKQAVFINY